MTRSGHRIAVIVPALDEAALVGLAVRSAEGAARVIVADGGSRDGTIEAARNAGALVVDSEPGRARQLNAGARAAADCDVLLFLHADTTLPRTWSDDVAATLAKPDCVAGAFDFSVGDATARDRLITRMGSARARLTAHPYGDQALFMRRDTFERLGGFPDQPLMEDWEAVRRLRRHGRIAIARTAITTSTRQWDEGGLIRSTAVYLAVIAGYRLGVAPQRLERVWRRTPSGRRAPSE